MHGTLQLLQWTVTYGYLVFLVTKEPTTNDNSVREEYVRKLGHLVLYLSLLSLNFCCILNIIFRAIGRICASVMVVSLVLPGAQTFTLAHT